MEQLEFQLFPRISDEDVERIAEAVARKMKSTQLVDIYKKFPEPFRLPQPTPYTPSYPWDKWNTPYCGVTTEYKFGAKVE